MARDDDADHSLKCSFCGKTQEQVRRLIAGPAGVYICVECVGVCNDLIEEELGRPETDEPTEPPRPREIHRYLDQYVIGQEDAKRALAVAVYNHYKRVRDTAEDGGPPPVELAKSNILLLGPTGCGKTYLAQTLARSLNVPFAIADATALTEAGYVGEDVENILLKLLQAADYDVARAEKGIIYLDEIDKIARKSENPSLTRDVSGEGVQQALLKIMEGTVAAVPPQGGRKHPQQELIEIDTSQVLFIAAGAFAGLESIVGDRLGGRGIGFGGEVRSAAAPPPGDPFAGVQPADLVKYGLIPEFIGRLPVITRVTALDRAALLRTLTEPRNALVKQYQRLFELDGVQLEFDRPALDAIIDRAMLRGTGARALRGVMERVLQPLMYEIPGRADITHVVVDEPTVRRHTDSRIPRQRRR